MILKSLRINNYGPFAIPTTISFDENTTVLTGQNDTGKSSVLRLLQIIRGDYPLEEDDVNIDHIFEANTPWTEDDDIYCIGTYIISEKFPKYFRTIPKNFGDGWEVDIKYYLAPNKKRAEIVKIRDTGGNNVVIKDISFRKANPVILLPSQKGLNSVVDTVVHESNSLDDDLLLLGFGRNYASKLNSLGDINLNRETRSAAERLTNLSKKVFPPSMGIKFIFDKMVRAENSQSHKMIINIRDKDDSDTALHLRGTGVQKLLSSLITISNSFVDDEHLLILFDEPENSLHANAQHMLRAFLEGVGANQNIQVIYVTHSPSMINTMYPHGIRLFSRDKINGKATTIVDNQPVKDNFFPIRSSLGLSPSDSLLYAPITIIVEGNTEVLGLPLLLRRLFEEKIQGFENVNKLIPFSHVLDGHGASFEYWCRMAKSQGCKPIIFVDGDRARQVRQQRVQEEHPDVPIIILENMSEFEEIIPQDIYFQALTNNSESQGQFSTWTTTANLPNRLAFTKQVDRWLQEVNPDFYYDKPDTMKKAIELVDLKNVHLEKIRELVERMADILNSNQYE